MTKAITIGSLTLDLFFQDSSLTIKKNRFNLAIGGKYVTEYFNQALGGGGANVAIGLSRAGIKSALWSEIGIGGVAKLIMESLEKEGVDISLLEQREDFANVSSILLSPRGERTIINHRSHSVKLEKTERVEKAFIYAKLFYLGNMPELTVPFRTQLLRTAQKSGLITALNLGVKDCRLGRTVLAEMLKSVNYLILNRYELADILHTPPNELLFKEINYFSKLGLGEGAVLVITDGQFGSYAQTKDQIYYQVAYKVDSVTDATGAGDAFTSGFLAGIYYQEAIVQSLHAGARNSASVIKKVGAQAGLLTRDKLFS